MGAVLQHAQAISVDDRVVAPGAIKPIGVAAHPAQQGVIALAAVQRIGTGVAFEVVVAAQPGQGVCAAAVQGIASASAGQSVSALTTKGHKTLRRCALASRGEPRSARGDVFKERAFDQGTVVDEILIAGIGFDHHVEHRCTVSHPACCQFPLA